MNIKMAIEFVHAGIMPVEMAANDNASDEVLVGLLSYAKKLMIEAEGVLTNAAKREEETRYPPVPTA